MSPQLTKMVGITVVLLCVAAFGLGVTLLGKAGGMLPHIDEPRARELTLSFEREYSNMSLVERQQRESEIAGLRTAKWPLYNFAIRICLITVTFAVAIVRFRLWDIRNMRTVTTPRTRGRLIALSSLAWLALAPAMLLEIDDEIVQDDLLPASDAGLGETLSMMIGASLVVWVISVVICRFVVLRYANLPAALWYVDYSTSYRNKWLRVFYGAAIVALAAFTALSLVVFKWGIPSGLVGIYVMLSSRAGLLGSTSQQGHA
jgi:hypothetical protein